jgi:hypothetical protein
MIQSEGGPSSLRGHATQLGSGKEQHTAGVQSILLLLNFEKMFEVYHHRHHMHFLCLSLRLPLSLLVP